MNEAKAKAALIDALREIQSIRYAHQAAVKSWMTSLDRHEHTAKAQDATIANLRDELIETKKELAHSLKWDEAEAKAYELQYAEMKSAHEELVEVKDELQSARDEFESVNMAFASALNRLWEDLLPKSYGEWDYPNQAYRFIKEEVEKLRDELRELKQAVDEGEL